MISLYRPRAWLSVLLISALAMPWCLMMCEQMLAQPPVLSAATSDAMPCHTVVDADTVLVVLDHDRCFACSHDVVTVLTELSYPALWLVTDLWLRLFALPAYADPLYFAQPPPLLQTAPLFWQHALLLI